MQHHTVLKVAAKLLLPFILLFALYVQFHGDFGPGGGFQAGVIFGAGIILYALVFGTGHARAVVPPGAVRAAAALGVLLYTGVGVASLLLGANFLDYGVLAADPVAGQHLGILLVELGVGLTVTAVMILLFYAFAGVEGAETDRAAANRDDVVRAAADRAAANRNGAERAAVDRAVADRGGAERAAADRAVANRDGAERAAAGRVVANLDSAARAAANRDGVVRAAADRAVASRNGAERAAADRAVADRDGASRVGPDWTSTS